MAGWVTEEGGIVELMNMVRYAVSDRACRLLEGRVLHE